VLHELIQAQLLCLIPFTHAADVLALEPGNRVIRAQAILDIVTRGWGGQFGQVARTDPLLRLREYAVVPWLNAFIRHQTFLDRTP
jgi:hypothetical protein